MAESFTFSTAVVGAGFHLVGHDVIDRQIELDVTRLRVREDVARRVELVGLDERLAGRQAERLEERVGHRAADQEAIDARRGSSR